MTIFRTPKIGIIAKEYYSLYNTSCIIFQALCKMLKRTCLSHYCTRKQIYIFALRLSNSVCKI